jgi:hypothetical protein
VSRAGSLQRERQPDITKPDYGGQLIHIDTSAVTTVALAASVTRSSEMPARRCGSDGPNVSARVRDLAQVTSGGGI